MNNCYIPGVFTAYLIINFTSSVIRGVTVPASSINEPESEKAKQVSLGLLVFSHVQRLMEKALGLFKMLG